MRMLKHTLHGVSRVVVVAGAAMSVKEIYDAYQASDDSGDYSIVIETTVGEAGSWIGSIIGGTAGVAGGPPGAIAGGVAGGMAGEKTAKALLAVH